MEKVVINYKPEDYLQANRLHLRACGKKILTIIMPILILIIFFAKCLSISPGDNQNFYVLEWTVYPYDIFMLLLALFLLAYPYVILPIKIRFWFKRQKFFESQVELQFDQKEIIAKSNIGETKLIYAYLCVISNDMIVVYNTPKTFMPLPRKYCQDSQQFRRIVDVVKNFPSRKILNYIK